MRRPARDRGAVSVEYTLLALFIAVAAVIGITVFGGAVHHLFEQGTNVVPSSPGH